MATERALYRYHNEASRSTCMTYARLDAERFSRAERNKRFGWRHIELPNGECGYVVEELDPSDQCAPAGPRDRLTAEDR